MNHTAELMQKTVSLTWNKPEWMLPKAQTEVEKQFGYVSVIIASLHSTKPGRYSIDSMRFFDYDAEPIDAQDVEFWAYMPKHPNK